MNCSTFCAHLVCGHRGVSFPMYNLLFLHFHRNIYKSFHRRTQKSVQIRPLVGGDLPKIGMLGNVSDVSNKRLGESGVRGVKEEDEEDKGRKSCSS